MVNQFGYKKYMKKTAKKDMSLLQIFVITVFGMLLVFTFLIKSFSPTVDTSIGNSMQEQDVQEEAQNVDSRLTMIQDEDQGKSFTELMSKAEDVPKMEETSKPALSETVVQSSQNDEIQKVVQQDPLYKVYIGNYTTSEQAKVAKDIIQESGVGLTPIVKCIGSNSYTLQVGIFKNKKSADALLYTVQQNHLPGRIVQEY